MRGQRARRRYGGAAAGAVAYALAMQEVARACASTAVTMAVTNMVGEVIARFGTEEQRAAHCPKLASGEYAAGAFALSEPEAGSDPGGMATTATREGRRVGPRAAPSSGSRAAPTRASSSCGRGPATARTHPGTRGISCFLVEGGHAGAEGRARRGQDGHPRVEHRRRSSSTACRVPESALLGELNGGLQDRDDGARRRPHRHQRAGDRHRARGARGERRLREGPKAVRPSDRATSRPSSGSSPTSKTELDAAHLLCMRAAWLKEAGRVVLARGVDGEALRERGREPHLQPTRSRSTAATATRASSPPSATCATCA